MVKDGATTLLFTFISLIIFQISSSSSTTEQNIPSADSIPLLSLKLKPNQTTAASSCSYRVQIITSCSSVKYTRDQISLSFGDAYNNQVYVKRIDDPRSRTFEACSKDTFDINGPCTRGDVCYVHLYRRGTDGWNVESVRISGRTTRTVTFNYRSWVPSDQWWGYNKCNGLPHIL